LVKRNTVWVSRYQTYSIYTLHRGEGASLFNTSNSLKGVLRSENHLTSPYHPHQQVKRGVEVQRIAKIVNPLIKPQ
jgi:hypothetical protein